MSVNLPIYAGACRVAAVNIQNHSISPFPFSASAATNAQKEVFSYALESGFIRISFADMAAEKADNMQKPPAIGTQDKQIYGLITMDLKQGWKTYWRNPGTSGFPPKISLNGGAKAEILFPAPQLFQGPGEWTYGYKTHVLLPFRIILPKQPRQNFYAGTLSIGICETLCMPQKIPFQFTAASQHKTQESAKIAAALKTLPKAADKDFRILSAKVIKGRIRLVLRYPHDQGEYVPQLFLDGGDIQMGLAEPLAVQAVDSAGNKTGKGKTLHNIAKTNIQIYETQLLFGEAKTGEPIAYTAVLKNGTAVSGIVKITTPKTKK